MVIVQALALAGLFLAPGAGEAKVPGEGLVARWRLDGGDAGRIADSSGRGHAGTLHGDVAWAPGVVGRSLRLDGRRGYVSVPDAAELSPVEGAFSVTAWVNVYALRNRGQQMIAAKNVYSADKREWGVMVDRDGLFRCYLRADGRWQTVASTARPEPGVWMHVAVVLKEGRAALYVNGRREGEAAIQGRIRRTDAPVTLGGVNNGGTLMQTLFGALDEVCLFSRALSEEEIQGMQVEGTPRHEVPALPAVERFRLWEGDLPPAETEVPLLEGVRFIEVKKREPEVDGYDWLHGGALIFRKGVLFTSWGHNKGAENTPTEVLRGRRSRDGGATWLPVETIGPGGEGEANSHAVFLTREGVLWTFAPRFGKGPGRFAGLAMEAFVLDEATDRWVSRAIVARGIWPLQPPVRLENGNWIVPGCDENWKAAVAISRGDDLLHWDTVRIPVGDRVHTEAALWADGPNVIVVMRNQSPEEPDLNCAAVSLSGDYGRTWSPSRESNFPMATSKPVAGVLSTGQRFLVCNACQENCNSRRTMVVAVSRPGEQTLSRMWRLETGNRALSYPYAVEHEDSLYVIYSSAAPGLGGNRNDCRLAIIPLPALRVE